MSREDVVAVFPLPDVVFFPKTNLPLHVFEPRYRQMVQDTIENQQLIGMFLLQPGWQSDYYGNPPVRPVGCAGELVEVETLPEGKFNIVLRGLYRARATEIVQQFPYRRARVEVLPELIEAGSTEVEQLHRRLMEDYERLLVNLGANPTRSVRQITDFAEVVNLLCTVLQFDLEAKIQLLQEDSVCKRARMLLEFMQRQLTVFDWVRHYGHLRSSDPDLN